MFLFQLGAILGTLKIEYNYIIIDLSVSINNNRTDDYFSISLNN